MKILYITMISMFTCCSIISMDNQNQKQLKNNGMIHQRTKHNVIKNNVTYIVGEMRKSVDSKTVRLLTNNNEEVWTKSVVQELQEKKLVEKRVQKLHVKLQLIQNDTGLLFDIQSEEGRHPSKCCCGLWEAVRRFCYDAEPAQHAESEIKGVLKLGNAMIIYPDELDDFMKNLFQ